MSKVRERLKERGFEWFLTDEAKEFIINKGSNLDYGARPLRRAIEQRIEDPLSKNCFAAPSKGRIRSSSRPSKATRQGRSFGLQRENRGTPSAPAESTRTGRASRIRRRSHNRHRPRQGRCSVFSVPVCVSIFFPVALCIALFDCNGWVSAEIGFAPAPNDCLNLMRFAFGGDHKIEGGDDEQCKDRSYGHAGDENDTDAVPRLGARAGDEDERCYAPRRWRMKSSTPTQSSLRSFDNASSFDLPCSCNVLANSTNKIPFFATRPTK